MDLLWETPVPGMETDLALADGTVLLGSQDGHLYILDGKTGQIQGKYDFQEEVYSPVVASGKVFITSRSTLYALGEKERKYYESVIVGILVITVLGFVIYLKKKRYLQ